MTEPLLEIRDLRVEFRTRRGVSVPVDGVGLDVEAGKVTCIVGESGCGKSLTSLAIMGLIPRGGRVDPASHVLFKGRDLVAMSESSRRAIRGRDLAMIFQDPMASLNPVHRIGDQIVEAIRIHERTSRRAARARTAELLSLVGINPPRERMESFPHELSGGMRQRVMIAMALACEPDLLIADEPTTALDATIQAQILTLLLGLRERLGMAILLITHDIGVVAEVADEVAVMYAGRIVERGATAAVLRTPGHPYTQALLEAVPTIGRDRSAPLRTIPGQVPAPEAWPVGCRFARRCQFAEDRCWEDYPPYAATVEGTSAACWLHHPEHAGHATEGMFNA